MENKKWLVKFRVFLGLVLVGLTAFFLYQAIIPGGKITYSYNFEGDGYKLAGADKFISKLTPAERVVEAKDDRQKLIADPVYFSLRTPRKLSRAKLTIEYKNESDRPLLEAGVLMDKTVWRYLLQPIENKILDQLVLVWSSIEKDGVMLLQREKKYDSIESFLSSPPASDEIALYNYELKKDYWLENYQPSQTKQEINYSLRGPYQFYTYLKNEDLDFVFTLSDLNKNKDSDPVDLILYYNNQPITSEHLDDDGIISDSGQRGEVREIKLKQAGLPEGVYKIELRANSDIITEKIITSQSRLSFLNKLWLTDENKNNFSLFTDSQALNAETINPSSLQTLKVGEDDLALSETYRQFSRTISPGVKEIAIERGDLILSGNGVFSFKADNLVNPNFKKVDESFPESADGINYILARYKTPDIKDGWKTAEVEFDLNNAYREWNKNSFIISIPGLRTEDGLGDFVEIKKVKISLSGKTLLAKLKEFLNR